MRANWQTDLIEWSNDMLGRELEWGETDCASIVLSVVSMAYDDPEIDAKAPESLSEAVERFEKGETPAQWLKSVEAESEPNLRLAQRGNLVIIPDDEFDLQAAGVCLGFDQFMVSNSETGVVRVDRSDLPDSSYLMKLPEEFKNAG